MNDIGIWITEVLGTRVWRIIRILVESFPKLLKPCLQITITLTVLSFFFGLILALILALVQVANIKGLKQFARFYVWIFRGTPLMLQLFIIFYGLPSFGINFNGYVAAVITFSLNLAAYNSEIIRSGGPERSGIHDRVELLPGHDPCRTSAGRKSRVPAFVQLFDRTDQGYFLGFFHNGHRNDVGCQEGRCRLL